MNVRAQFNYNYFCNYFFDYIFRCWFLFPWNIRRKSAVEEGPMIYIVESRKFHIVGRTRTNFVCLFVRWCLTHFFLCTKCLLTKSSLVYSRFHNGCMKTVLPKAPQFTGLWFFTHFTKSLKEFVSLCSHSLYPCSSILLVREECPSISAVWYNVWRHPLVCVLSSLGGHARQACKNSKINLTI